MDIRLVGVSGFVAPIARQLVGGALVTLRGIEVVVHRAAAHADDR